MENNISKDSRNLFKIADENKQTVCIVTKLFCRDNSDCRRCNIPFTDYLGRLVLLMSDCKTDNVNGQKLDIDDKEQVEKTLGVVREKDQIIGVKDD